MIKKKYFLPSEYTLFSYEKVKSTMITAKELVNSGEKNGTIVWAKIQTNGRGRHGRAWVSPLGNLYFSFIREAKGIKKHNYFSPVYITSLALVVTLEEVSKGLIKPFIKWPNDILINGSKLAGILIEKFVSNKNNNLYNIGLGINVSSSPDNLDYTTTNLIKENVNIDTKDLLFCFFENLSRIEVIFKNEGLELILKNWKKYSHNRGDKLMVKLGNKTLEGRFVGIDENGALLLLHESGSTETIYAGDVFIL